MSANGIKILIQIAVAAGEPVPVASDLERRLATKGLTIDPDYNPVPGQDEAGKPVLTFRGVIPVQELSILRAKAGVAGVWEDAQIEPLGGNFGMT